MASLTLKLTGDYLYPPEPIEAEVAMMDRVNLELTLLEDSRPIDLSGYNLYIGCEDQRGTVLFEGTVTAPAAGLATATIQPRMPGRLTLRATLVSEDDGDYTIRLGTLSVASEDRRGMVATVISLTKKLLDAFTDCTRATEQSVEATTDSRDATAECKTATQKALNAAASVDDSLERDQAVYDGMVSATADAITATNNAVAATDRTTAAAIAAENATREANDAIASAQSAIDTATQAATTIDTAVANAQTAVNEAQTAVGAAQQAIADVQTASETATEASAKAVEAQQKAETAVAETQAAILDARAATEAAEDAAEAADTAAEDSVRRIDEAIFDANTQIGTAITNAEGRIDTAITTAEGRVDTAVVGAENATTTANTAATNADEAVQRLQEEAGPVPVGTIIWSAAATVPNGYLLCNGVAIGRAAYPDLFEAIGTMYGEGDGSTTFNLPNLIGKFLEGSQTAGTIHEAGLPNITGHEIFRFYGTNANYDPMLVSQGAFYSGPSRTLTYTAGNMGESAKSNAAGTSLPTLGIDASRSSPVYGKSSTVQPPSVTALPCIKAFNAVVGNPVIVASELAQEVASKLPLSGGIMTGNILFTAGSILTIPDGSYKRLIISAENDNDTAGYNSLMLFSSDSPQARNRATLRVKDSYSSSGYSDFTVREGGVISFNDKTIECAVEKGSGYLKFSDGTQICWAAFNASSQGSRINFPRAFSTPPAITFARAGGDYYNVWTNEIQASYFTAKTNSTDAFSFRYIAIGTGA